MTNGSGSVMCCGVCGCEADVAVEFEVLEDADADAAGGVFMLAGEFRDILNYLMI